MRQTTLVACELNVPVASRSTDERAVVAIVSLEPTKLVKTQNVNVKMKRRRNVTYGSSYSHGRRRETLSAHVDHCRRETSAFTQLPCGRTGYQRDIRSVTYVLGEAVMMNSQS